MQILKEENKNSKNNVNLIKLRINKLQNEEKASIRELEKTKITSFFLRISSQAGVPILKIEYLT